MYLMRGSLGTSVRDNELVQSDLGSRCVGLQQFQIEESVIALPVLNQHVTLQSSILHRLASTYCFD
jgi:hypothetical protein